MNDLPGAIYPFLGLNKNTQKVGKRLYTLSDKNTGGDLWFAAHLKSHVTLKVTNRELTALDTEWVQFLVKKPTKIRKNTFPDLLPEMCSEVCNHLETARLPGCLTPKVRTLYQVGTWLSRNASKSGLVSKA